MSWVLPELTLGAAGGTALRVMLERSGLSSAKAHAYADHLALGGLIGPALDWYRANGVNVLRTVDPVTVPTTLIWGAGDPAITRTAVEACEQFVDAEYRLVVADEGHWLPERQPDLVVKHVLARVASVDDKAGVR